MNFFGSYKFRLGAVILAGAGICLPLDAVASSCGCGGGDDGIPVTVKITGIGSAVLKPKFQQQRLTITEHQPEAVFLIKTTSTFANISISGWFDSYKHYCDSATVTLTAPCGYVFSTGEREIFRSWHAPGFSEQEDKHLSGGFSFEAIVQMVIDPSDNGGSGSGSGGGGSGGSGGGGRGSGAGLAPSVVIAPDPAGVTLESATFRVRNTIALGRDTEPQEGRYPGMGLLRFSCPIDASSVTMNHFAVDSMGFDEGAPADPSKKVFWSSTTGSPRVLVSPEVAVKLSDVANGVKAEVFHRGAYDAGTAAIAAGHEAFSTYVFGRGPDGNRITIHNWIHTPATEDPTSVEEFWADGATFHELAGGRHTEAVVIDGLEGLALTGNVTTDEAAIRAASRSVLRVVRDAASPGSPVISRTIEEFGYIPQRDLDVETDPPTLGAEIIDILQVKRSIHHDLDGNGAVDDDEPVETWAYYGEQPLAAEHYGLLGRTKYHETPEGAWELYGYEAIRGTTPPIETTGSRTVTYGGWKDTPAPDPASVGIVGSASPPSSVSLPLKITTRETLMAAGTSFSKSEEFLMTEDGLELRLRYSDDTTNAIGRTEIHTEEHAGVWEAGTGDAWTEFSGAAVPKTHRMVVTTYGTKDPSLTVSEFYGDQFKIVPGHSRQEIEIYGRSGLILKETRILPADASGPFTAASFEPATRETYAYDARHRLVEVRRDGRIVSSRQYPTEFSQLETDEEGVTTRSVWDLQGRLVSRTRLAGGGVGDLAAGYEYEGLETRNKMNGVLIGRAVEDLYGRPVLRQDQAGGVTTWSYADRGRVVTETQPSGGTVVTVRHADGKMASVTGSAAVERHFDYGGISVMHPVLGWEIPHYQETEIVGPPDSPRRRMTIYDSFTGDARDVRSPNAETGQLDVVDSTEAHVYSIAGAGWTARKLLDGSAEVAGNANYPALSNFGRTPGATMGMHTLSGSVGAWDYTRPLAAAGTRLTETHTFYVKEDGHWWEKTIRRRGIETAPATVESSTMTRLWQGDGQRMKTVSEDGETTDIATTFNPATGESTVTAVSNRSAVPVITHRVNGRVQWVQGKHSDSPEHRASYSYDSFGRITGVRDHRGAVTRTVYNASGQVERTIDTLGRPTRYTYVPPGQPGAGQIATITRPDGTTKTYAYTPRGELATIGGSSEYFQTFAYNAYGDRETLTTNSAAGDVVTRWEYNAAGLVSAKYYNWQPGDTPSTPGTVNYHYDPFGRLKTKAVAGGKATGYRYNIFGELTGIDYGNDGTPDTVLERDAAGFVGTATEDYEDAAGASLGHGVTSYTYTAGQIDKVEYDAAHPYLPGVKLDYKNPDAAGRPAGYEVFNGSTSRLDVGYGYDSSGRLAAVGSLHGTFTYAYHPGSGIVSGYIGVDGGNPVIGQSRPVDFQNRISSVVTRNGSGNIVASIGYTHDAADRRTQARREDGSWWNYAYNMRGEVVEAKRHTVSGAAIDGLRRKYEYDNIGNRTVEKFGLGADGATLSEIGYQVNAFNQYTSITHPGKSWVVGRAPEGAGVDVNGDPAGRQETWFSKELTSANTTGPVRQPVEVRDESGTLAEQREGHLSIPKATTAPQYDAAGNLVLDDRWTYEWDSENRLRKMTPTPAAIAAGFPNRTVEFAYDWQGRRIAKKVTEGSTITHKRYLYEAWNVVAEWTLHGGATTFNTPQTYLWGLDLAGQSSGDVRNFQGAGGVGGLLAANVIKTSDSTVLGKLHAAYDGNGNILGWLGSDGELKRSQDYDAFGNVVLARTASSGPLADDQGELDYGFSTKPEDLKTGLIYYGYRFYNPVLGRWMSRDPIEEKGGINIYGILCNCAINYVDVLGCSGYIDSGPFYRHWLWGGGADYHVSFYDYAPNWGALEFSDYVKAQRQICLKKVGESIEINQIKNYDTGGGPGRVNVRLSGMYTKDSECSWKFNGEITIDDDVYNFDARDYGQRDGNNSWFYPKENATRIGGMFGGNDYTIKFDGSRNVDTYNRCH